MFFADDVKYILVKQIASPIGRKSDQRLNLIGLGLNKIGRKRKLPHNKAIVGMVNKVKHLVEVYPAAE